MRGPSPVISYGVVFVLMISLLFLRTYVDKTTIPAWALHSYQTPRPIYVLLKCDREDDGHDVECPTQLAKAWVLGWRNDSAEIHEFGWQTVDQDDRFYYRPWIYRGPGVPPGLETY